MYDIFLRDYNNHIHLELLRHFHVDKKIIDYYLCMIIAQL